MARQDLRISILRKQIKTVQDSVPIPPGGTSSFLRADGTWSAPPAGEGSNIITGFMFQDGFLYWTLPTSPYIQVPEGKHLYVDDQTGDLSVGD